MLGRHVFRPARAVSLQVKSFEEISQNKLKPIDYPECAHPASGILRFFDYFQLKPGGTCAA